MLSAMTLRCLLFGHLRSRSRATLDEKHGRWISECKRCRVPMARESDGTWVVVPPALDGKLEPVEPKPKPSASSGGRPGEPPLTSADAKDSADRRCSAAAKGGQKSVDLAAS
jgi:hypothetical protein